MRIAKKLSLMLLAAFICAFVPWLILLRPAAIESAGSSRVTIENQKEGRALKDPCWFVTLDDKSIPYEMISKREDRQLHGYANDILLKEAVKIYNEEAQCVSSVASYPPLTEDELIAAIVAGPDNVLSGNARKYQQDVLWRIASQKILPKGALLLAITGSRVQGSLLKPDGTIRANGISIILRLGLENQKLGDSLRDEQTFVVRKTYFNVEVIK